MAKKNKPVETDRAATQADTPEADTPEAETSAVEYVCWMLEETRAVMGYGHLEPGSVHEVAALPGNPLEQLGETFEVATREDFEAWQAELEKRRVAAERVVKHE